MKQEYKCYLILLLIVTLFWGLTCPGAAVSDLEQQVAKRNLKLYQEKYGVANLSEYERKKIDKIFQRLTEEAKKDAPQLNFQYQIIAAPVINAAYLGAGQMILFKGLIEEVETKEQLAAIIAHELGHGVNDDIEEKLDWIQTIQLGTLLADLAGDGEINEDQSSRITAIALNLMQKGYSRTQEQEADYYSVFLTKRAGYNPEGAVEVMKLLKRKSKETTDSELLEIFAEHPNLDKRINYLNELVVKLAEADKYYSSPISTGRRFTKGLLKGDMQQVYETYSHQVQQQLSVAQFVKQEQLQVIRSKVNNLSAKATYQIELRNQVEGTARVAVLFAKSNDAILGLALDLKKSNYGWKVANQPDIY